MSLRRHIDFEVPGGAELDTVNVLWQPPAVAYRGLVLGHSPMGYWRLDEALGAAVAVDQSPNANDATVSATGVTLGEPGASSNLGGSFNFDGSSGLIQAPDDLSLTATTHLTVMAWVNPVSTSGVRPIVVKQDVDGAGTPEYGWFFYQDALHLAVRYYDATLRYRTTLPPTDTWSFIAATLDIPALDARFYRNGAPTTATLDAQSGVLSAMTNGPHPLSIGYRPRQSAAEHFHGHLQEVAVFARVLSATQIAELYSVGAG